MQITDGSKYVALAGEAAGAHLNDGRDLSEKVAELAVRHNLNNDEIDRVIQGSNHLVHKAMRPSTTSVEFNIASREKVASVLGRRPKVAMARYELAPEVEKVAGEAESDPFEASRARMQKRENEKLSRERAKVVEEDHQGLILDAREKVSDCAERLLRTLEDYDGDLADAAEKFATYPKLASRPELLVDVLGLVKAAGQLHQRPVIFTQATMDACSEEGRAKVADQVDPELYSPGLSISGMPVTVMNGTHQLWKDLDTLVDQYDQTWSLIRGGIPGTSDLCAYDVTGVRSRDTGDANHGVGSMA